MSGEPGEPATPGRPAAFGAARLLIVGALLLGLAGTAALAESKLPLTVQDPRTGEAVVLEAGPRALHVVFFATWCPPCLEELERLAEMEARWGNRGYRLVLVALAARQTAPRLEAFAEERRPPGRLLFDADGAAQQAFSAGMVPTHLVLDSSGEVVARSSFLSPEIAAKVRELLAVKERPARRGS